jgi:hypothetical protein
MARPRGGPGRGRRARRACGGEHRLMPSSTRQGFRQFWVSASRGWPSADWGDDAYGSSGVGGDSSEERRSYAREPAGADRDCCGVEFVGTVADGSPGLTPCDAPVCFESRGACEFDAVLRFLACQVVCDLVEAERFAAHRGDDCAERARVTGLPKCRQAHRRSRLQRSWVPAARARNCVSGRRLSHQASKYGSLGIGVVGPTVIDWLLLSWIRYGLSAGRYRWPAVDVVGGSVPI